MRTIFFGTPDFAVPTLNALAASAHEVALVVSQPARPVGRGRKLQDPPVARWARDHGLEVRQPEKVRQADFMAHLRALEPDVAVVVAFGQIFRRELLELPRLGCVNLHASLLPRYRGAAPIQTAIAAGETTTGVTTMKMDVGLDSGPILLQAALEIGPEETAGELAPRLAERGAELMVETLAGLAAGTLEARPQDPTRITLAPLLSKADAEVDWTSAAPQIHDRLRGFTPWPGLKSGLSGAPLKLLELRPLDPAAAAEAGLATDREPGTLLGFAGPTLAVTAGGGTIVGLERVQRPGRKPISAVDLWNGEHLGTGERFHLSDAA